MKKIKNFKINLRNREIARLLKKTSKIPDISPDIEDKIEAESRRLKKVISPAAVYETLPKEKYLGELSLNGPQNWVAATAYLVTVGPKIEDELKSDREEKDDALEIIDHSVAMEGIDQSVNFIERLIRDEALVEDCETSKEKTMDQKDILKKVLDIIPAEKIGIQLTNDGNLNPQYSSSGIIYWMPVKKSRK